MKLATREAIAFRSAAMLNIYALKTGCEFVMSSDLNSKFLAYSNISTLQSGFKNVWIRRPDLPDTCVDGRQIRKFKNIRIRVGRGQGIEISVIHLILNVSMSPRHSNFNKYLFN